MEVPYEQQREKAIRLAQELYRERRAQGIDLSTGPCLAEEIIPDWCVDVSHSPRLEIDNLGENRCRSFINKRVHHFVELDVDGNLIRAV